MSLYYRVTKLNEYLLFQGLTIQSASASRFHGFPPCANAIFPPFCKRERERVREERERENDRRLLAVVISPLHKVPFALPSA